MLTGDNEHTAAAVGKQAGVDEVIAGVLPDGKEAAIRRLQQEGAVAMVGDGINDAPALTRADTGIAIGAGTDVAIDAADVVLMNSRLSDVPAAIRLSRATLRNIREDLFWAFIYNVIGIRGCRRVHPRVRLVARSDVRRCGDEPVVRLRRHQRPAAQPVPLFSQTAAVRRRGRPFSRPNGRPGHRAAAAAK